MYIVMGLTCVNSLFCLLRLRRSSSMVLLLLLPGGLGILVLRLQLHRCSQFFHTMFLYSFFQLRITSSLKWHNAMYLICIAQSVMYFLKASKGTDFVVWTRAFWIRLRLCWSSNTLTWSRRAFSFKSCFWAWWWWTRENFFLQQNIHMFVIYVNVIVCICICNKHRITIIIYIYLSRLWSMHVTHPWYTMLRNSCCSYRLGLRRYLGWSSWLSPSCCIYIVGIRISITFTAISTSGSGSTSTSTGSIILITLTVTRLPR